MFIVLTVQWIFINWPHLVRGIFGGFMIGRLYGFSSRCLLLFIAQIMRSSFSRNGLRLFLALSLDSSLHNRKSCCALLSDQF